MYLFFDPRDQDQEFRPRSYKLRDTQRNNRVLVKTALLREGYIKRNCWKVTVSVIEGRLR